MTDIVLFINDNFVWFIIIGVVLLMALIGYVAEKHDFKKEEKPEKPKVKPTEDIKEVESPVEEVKEGNKEELVENIVDQPEIDFNNFDTDLEIVGEETEVKEVTPTFDDLNEVTEEVEETPVLEPTPMEEDLNAPLEGAEVVEETAPELESIPEDLYAPIGDTVEEQPEEVENPIEAELPELDTIKEENDENVSEDDIWKF